MRVVVAESSDGALRFAGTCAGEVGDLGFSTSMGLTGRLVSGVALLSNTGVVDALSVSSITILSVDAEANLLRFAADEEELGSSGIPFLVTLVRSASCISGVVARRTASLSLSTGVIWPFR